MRPSEVFRVKVSVVILRDCWLSERKRFIAAEMGHER